MDTPLRPTSSPSPATPTQPVAAKPKQRPINSREEILFVGMNKESRSEATNLRQHGMVPVTAVFDGREQGKITIRQQGQLVKCNLTTDEGIARFVGSLNLPEEQSQQIAEVFRSVAAKKSFSSHSPAAALDELAQIAQVWARAERGGRMPSRMVLSGHSIGDGVWGDGNGKLGLDMLARLAEAMPKAARGVEDLHMSACSSGGERNMDRLRGIFPNVKTIWAYSSSAPGTWSGAMTHLSRWEKATRGSRTDLDRAIAEGTRKGENVSVWTIENGYQDGSAPQTLDVRKKRVEQTSAVVADYLSGRTKVDNPGSGPLREYYNAVIKVLQSRDLPESERTDFEAKRDQTIRLLYYTRNVAPTFTAHFQTAIREGYAAAGLAMPNFATLSRAEALAKIAEFNTAVEAMTDVPDAVTHLQQLLNDGLRDLQATVIPDTWV